MREFQRKNIFGEMYFLATQQLSPADLSSAQKEAARRHAIIQGETDN